MESEARAREVADFRARRDRQAQLARAAGGRGTLEEMIKGIREGTAKELPVLIKADVQGSVEALAGELQRLSTEEVATRVIYSARRRHHRVPTSRWRRRRVRSSSASTSAPTRRRARSPSATGSTSATTRSSTRSPRTSRQLMDGLLAPVLRETFLGNAQIREVFKITKVGKVAGCMVTEGVVKRGAEVRLLRDNVVIHEGTLKTLKRFKDEVREVQQALSAAWRSRTTTTSRSAT